MASISIRESIRWLPDPASEPTSTVVLTSPGRRFVDIRILRPEPGTAEASEDFLGEVPPSGLDWAFAGYSQSEMRGDGARHCVWRHFVDSRSAVADGVADEGDMFPRGDGRALETGRMVNPATGRETDYEEVWADVEPRSTAEGSSSSSKPLVRCVVLELKNDERGERGMVVCLGGYCQGVVRKGDAFALERWRWVDDGWKRLAYMGSLGLPCGEAMNETGLVVGNQVKCEEQVWNVVEVCDL
ncbi:hypothetical protein F5X96DRAFT_656655 [Biscogniauxia mediterranea]|nr:hypothetical protein F5X96DRAFT_656655 [Biscogniauxia mediterranea]